MIAAAITPSQVAQADVPPAGPAALIASMRSVLARLLKGARTSAQDLAS